MSTEEYPSERAAPSSGDSPAIYSDEWWENFAARNPRFGSTVEKVRDALDAPTWRSDRAKRLAAAEAAKQPARAIDPGLGRTKGRPYRQLNVKLGEPDFAALTSLAVERDLPPSTLARMLLRKAIQREVGG